jgi:hypothetical protein
MLDNKINLRHKKYKTLGGGFYRAYPGVFFLLHTILHTYIFCREFRSAHSTNKKQYKQGQNRVIQNIIAQNKNARTVVPALLTQQLATCVRGVAVMNDKINPRIILVREAEVSV